MSLSDKGDVLRQLVKWRDVQWQDTQSNDMGAYRLTRPTRGRPVRWEDDICGFAWEKGKYWSDDSSEAPNRRWFAHFEQEFVHR